jgi:hypothetical protein
MSAEPVLCFGLFELLVLLAGGGLMGTPPGDRDPALLKCPPAQCVYYTEWAERAAGVAGGPGIDGLTAEPEVREFARKLQEAIVQQIETSTANGDEREKVVGKTLPRLMASLIHRPGCLYVSYDAEAAENPAEKGVFPQFDAIFAGVRATLIVNAGEGADDVAAKIQQIVELFPAEIQKKNLDHQTFPDLPPGISLTLHRDGKYFILGFGNGTIDAAVTALKGETKGLAAEERFSTAMSRVAISRTSGVSWLDVKRLIEVASHVASQQGADVATMAASLGLDKLDSIASVTGVVDGQIRTRTFATTGGSTRGLLVLGAGRGMKAADFEHVPADADFVTALSVDPARLLETAQQLAAVGGENSRAQLDQIIKDVELQIDATFEGQIFPGFGNVLVLHDSPSAGGLFVTSLVGSLEVVDRNKAYLAYTGALDYLQGQLEDSDSSGGQRSSLKKERYLDETMWYVNVVGQNDFIFAPAFCMTESRLYITPHPQAMKSHLRFLKEKQPTFASKVGTEVPLNEGELIFAAHADTKSLVRYLYSIVPYVGQSILGELQRRGFKMDVYAIPSAPSVLPYLKNAFSTVVRTRDGLLMESQSAIPAPGGATSLTIVPPLLSLFAFRMPRLGALGEDKLELDAVLDAPFRLDTDTNSPQSRPRAAGAGHARETRRVTGAAP